MPTEGRSRAIIEPDGAEEGLYILPMIRDLLALNVTLTKMDSKCIGSALGNTSSKVIVVMTQVATPPALEPLSTLNKI